MQRKTQKFSSISRKTLLSYLIILLGMILFLVGAIFLFFSFIFLVTGSDNPVFIVGIPLGGMLVVISIVIFILAIKGLKGTS